MQRTNINLVGTDWKLYFTIICGDFSSIRKKCFWFFASSNIYKEVFEMFSLPKINTHKGHILYDLLCGKHLQNKKLFNEIDSCASAARIFELRSDGCPISDKSIYQVSKEGKDTRVKEYFIRRDDILNIMTQDSIKDFMQRAEKFYRSKK